MTGIDPEAMAKAVEGGAAFTEQQQAQAAAEAQAEAERVAAHEAANPTLPTVDKFREAGGYLLMDPQWTVAEGFGKTGAEANTPEARTELIEGRIADGLTAAWDSDGLNPLPLTPAGQAHLQGFAGAERREEALRMGLDAATYGASSLGVNLAWHAA